MSNLFGSNPKVIPEFTGLQVNTAVQSLPIPIIYGSPRVSINVIYYNGFNSQTVKASSGGKGTLSGGKGGAQQVNYYASFIAAIGEGQLGNLLIIYQDSNVWVPSDYPTNGAYYYNGSSTQTPWSYVVSRWPSDARPYKDTAYWAFSNAQIDSSATIPQINLVVQGLFQGTSPLNNSTITITTGQYNPNGSAASYIGNINIGDADADPAQCIYDFLTNVTYGANFPSSYIDTTTLFTSSNGFDLIVGDNALSTFCQAAGLAWSLVLNNAESAGSTLERLCKNLNTAIVWNGALLKFIPYWDTPTQLNPGWDSGNGIGQKYFVPTTTSIITITVDQILQTDDQGTDPIKFMRKDPTEVYNTVRLSFKDRNNFFNDNPVEATDPAHIELYGPRVDDIGSGSEFSLSSYANVSVTMQLRRNITIMRTFTWKMGPLWGWLEPMFVVTIPDPTNYSNTIIVRITSIEDDEDENSTITAEEFMAGSQSPSTIAVSQTTPPNQGVTNIPASPVYLPTMFTPPSAMLTATGFSTPQWIIGFSGGNVNIYNGFLDPNWGGANIFVSLDNVNYEEIGTLTGASTIGGLTSNLNSYSGANPDNTNTIYVNLNECNGTLSSYTTPVAAAGHSLFIVQDYTGFELMSYTTATLVSSYTYALTGLYRGLYGTSPRIFGAGSNFLYLGSGGNFFEINLPSAYYDNNFWVKLQSFSTFGNTIEALSSCVAYPSYVYTPSQLPVITAPTSNATLKRTLAKPNNSAKVNRHSQGPLKKR